MFTTLRTQDDMGEVVCISSSALPPQSGQSVVHFACDACRSKKLKCSGQKFGCQRCRSRNLTCIYSNTAYAKRPRSKKLSARPLASRPLPSPPSSVILSDTSRTVHKLHSISRGSAISTEHELSTRSWPLSINSPASASIGVHEALPAAQSPWSALPNSEFPLPSLDEPGFIFIDTEDNDSFLVDLESHHTKDMLQRYSMTPSEPDQTLAVHPTNKEIIPPFSNTETGSSAAFISDSYIHNFSGNSREPPCRCFSQTLGLLEVLANHDKVSNIRIANRTLYLLKQLISQHLTLSQCQTCASSHRLMTFLILLLEKMTGMLEHVASAWEEGAQSHITPCWTDLADLEESDGAPVLVGEYTVDTHQERSDLFGFLIFSQARRIFALCESLILRADQEHWRSHQDALQALLLRIRDLRETLSGSIDLQPPNA
ncbi:hypothetical protein BDZ85DRAFT_268971 [Elsinoe ampelina]|uniref:Zn(2)-C6 fungal-type domain-containing protein n=1 Tax=Elsinoe ampelina TaxID=302913 RepID=A0A6A6G0Q7_9PEZI|nr:hypothetical protein BDZ85DRAFT_268971 [Elsinoe ampelina]